jgi:hydroxyacylglutathione hydrolase
MFTVAPIPAFADNYIWRLQSDRPDIAVVVDPGDARPVLADLNKHNLELVAILVTHHHSDHVGGIRQLLDVYGDIPVYGPAREHIPVLTHRLKEGDEIKLPGMAMSFKVMDVPGHTAGHIAYYGDGILFCGDTVFAAGCGRIFDGTLEQLARSLQQIAKLPVDTQLYCAHEYTVDNIGFAKWVEPDNADLLERDKEDMLKAEQGRPTIPSMLATELKTNPFLRLDVPDVIAAAEHKAGRKLSTATEVFTVLRQWKDSEYD